MTAPAPDPGGRFEQSLFIKATPADVFACFFNHDALRTWWQASHAVVTPVPFGVYAIEWDRTSYRDDVLGPLGGVFHGTVVDVRPGQQLLVADCWWIPPEGDALGPMALHVNCRAEGDGCRLTVRQDGYDPSPRWRRYYAVVSRGWQLSLTALRRYCEHGEASPRSSGPPESPAAPPGN